MPSSSATSVPNVRGCPFTQISLSHKKYGPPAHAHGFFRVFWNTVSDDVTVSSKVFQPEELKDKRKYLPNLMAASRKRYYRDFFVYSCCEPTSRLLISYKKLYKLRFTLWRTFWGEREKLIFLDRLRKNSVSNLRKVKNDFERISEEEIKEGKNE